MIRTIRSFILNIRETRIIIRDHIRSLLKKDPSSLEPPFLASLAESYSYFAPRSRGGAALEKADRLSGLLDMDMPGRSYAGPIRLTDEETQMRKRLKTTVKALADGIGIRNTSRPQGLEEAAIFVEEKFREIGFAPQRLPYTTSDGHEVRNIEVVIPGSTDSPSLVIGAHYDSVDCPGANDNGSGIAGLLEIARYLRSKAPSMGRTVRLVAFVNEEPPYFHSSDMGSLVYALGLAKRDEKIYCMICLEMLGYYSDEPGSQQIPEPLRPVFNRTKGDFIGFTSNTDSKEALKEIVGRFRNYAHAPSEGLAAPSLIPGLSYSDHWSFWQAGYKAVMVTDTAFMRYPYYHTAEDTPDKLDYVRFTKVVSALAKTVLELALETD